MIKEGDKNFGVGENIDDNAEKLIKASLGEDVFEREEKELVQEPRIESKDEKKQVARLLAKYNKLCRKYGKKKGEGNTEVNQAYIEYRDALDRAEELAESQAEIKEISSNVLNGFDKLGIKKSDLENIEGFSSLSNGQQLLVLENLEQLNLGRIQEEASVVYRKDTVESNFLGRIWKGISKKYQIAKLEKSKAEEIIKGGVAIHGKTLQQLVNGMKEFGPEVDIKDGKLEIQYASGFNNLTGEQQKQINEFNQIANEYSKIPYEWSLETANKKDRKKYKEAKEKYDKAKGGILVLKEIEVNKRDAMLYVNDIEMKVKLNQFLNSNPDVEKQLQNIKDKKVWLRALANVITERGIYASAGFLTRTVTMSVIGIAGAPLAAAGVGGFLARKRGKERLKERSSLARKGIEDKSKEAKDFVDAEYIHESIDFLINELEKESLDSDKKDEVIRSLKFHIEDAKNKIEDGTVNYGGKENRLFNQYELIKKISEGAVQVEYNGINNGKYQKDIEVIGEFLKKQDKEISDKQKKYLRDQMIRGAIISAGFATAGYAIRDFIGEWLGGKEYRGSILPQSSEDINKSIGLNNIEAVKQAEELDKQIHADSKIIDKEFSASNENASVEQIIEEQQKTQQAFTDEEFNKIISNKHAISENEWGEVSKKLERMTPEQKIEYEKYLKKLGLKLPPVESLNVVSESSAELASEAPVAAMAKTVETEALPEYAVEKNDNLWKIIGKIEGIKDLEEGRKSNAIANVIEAIKNDPEKLKALGFKNAEDIHDLGVGQKIDLNKIKEVLDTETIGKSQESIIQHAEGLDNKTVENIEANDKLIADFHKARPDIPLNEKTTEFIINNPKADLEQVVYDKSLGEITIQEAAAEHTTKAVEAIEGLGGGFQDAPNETTKEFLEIFNRKGMAPDELNEITRITDVDLKNGIDAGERSKLEFLARHQELLQTPEQAQYLFNNSENDFELIKSIAIKNEMSYGDLAEKMEVSDFNIKNKILYGKVLAGDEPAANMKKLLGGADVEKVVFGRKGSAIAELADGRKVSIYNDGAEGRIEIEKPFWGTLLKRDTWMRKEFKVEIGKEGLNSVKKELGVKDVEVADTKTEEVDIPM